MKKYRLVKNNPDFCCSFAIEEKINNDWDIIAEFWDKKDAELFLKIKNKI
jgi:hypothetical protein